MLCKRINFNSQKVCSQFHFDPGEVYMETWRHEAEVLVTMDSVVTCSLMQTAVPQSVSVCAWAHLRQSGLFMADFMFADGCQLLQRVAVVGERSCKPRKLGPSCRKETWNTAYITFVINLDNTCQLPLHDKQSGVSQLFEIGVDTALQFVTEWSYKIFSQLPLVFAARRLAGAAPPVGSSERSTSPAFMANTHTAESVLERTTPPAAGFLRGSCPMSFDLCGSLSSGRICNAGSVKI